MPDMPARHSLWTTVILLFLTAHATAQQTTRPSVPERPGILFLRNMQASLEKANLTDEQRPRIAALMADLQKKAIQLRQEAANGTDVRGQLRTAINDFRAALFDILTPEQGRTVRQSMLALMAAGPPPGAGGLFAQPLVVQPKKPKPLAVQSVTTQPIGAAVGNDAPDFEVLSATGGRIKSANLKNRVVVLEFGSLSAPSFRDRAPDMQRVAEKYGARAFFLVIYTREQHAGDSDSQRNIDDGISVDQPADMDLRVRRANEARLTLHITLPMGVDNMDDSTADAYGGFPNATVVIGRDGKIFARQQWTDPSGLGRIIDAALAAQ